MSANPDVNRLSLQERIEVLESRVPTPEAGGGSDLLLNPKEVDQYPDNAFTDIGKGLLFKVSIPNIYAASNTDRYFDGLAFKAATLIPRVHGVLLSPLSAFVVIEITKNLGAFPPSSVATTNIFCPMNINTAALDKLMDYTNGFGAVKPFSFWLTETPSVFNAPQDSTSVNLLVGGTTLGILSNPTEIAFVKDGSRVGISFAFTRPRQAWLPYAYPCLSFACGRSPIRTLRSNNTPQTIGSGLDGSQVNAMSITVRNRQSFPERLKPAYPTSWYS